MIKGRRSIKRKMLAITADDYGPHPTINRGVIDAVKHNRVTSVGVMTNKYKALNKTSYTYEYNLKQEVDALIAAINHKDRNKKELREIGIGIHLSISSGSPITDNPELIPGRKDAHFRLIKDFRFSSKQAHLTAMQDEIEAQIWALKVILDEKNIPIDHVSCHQSLLYFYEDYNNCLFAALNNIYPPDQYSYEERPIIRTTLPISKIKAYKKKFTSEMIKEGRRSAVALIDNNPFKIPRLIIGTLNKRLKGMAGLYRNAFYIVPHYLFDNFYKKPSLKEIKMVYRAFPGGYTKNRGEFVVHLGDPFDYHVDLQLHGINHNYLPKRKNELKFLKMAPIYDYARRYGVEIVSMRNLR